MLSSRIIMPGAQHETLIAIQMALAGDIDGEG